MVLGVLTREFRGGWYSLPRPGQPKSDRPWVPYDGGGCGGVASPRIIQTPTRTRPGPDFFTHPYAWEAAQGKILVVGMIK